MREEYTFWNGAAVEYFSIPEAINREHLEKNLPKELTKQKPDLKSIIDASLSEGQSGLFGFGRVLEGRN